MNNGCVFCDIVAAKIPSWIVYENKQVICFLPNKLEVYGHTLIAPKAHYQDIYTVPQDLLESIIVTAKKLAIHYQNQIGSTGMNLLHASGIAAQQSVFHFHIHLIPRFNNDGLDTWPALPQSQYDKDEICTKLRL